MKGRKPKPVEQQILEGDPRKEGKRKLEKQLAATPKAAAGLPGCPRYLKGRARAAWNFWAAELAAMKLSKRPDGPMLEGACWAYARAVAAELIRDRDGDIFYDKHVADDGEVVILKQRKHPAVEIAARSWLLVRAFCSEFGLSPASRTRLTIDTNPEKEDDLAALLAQPRQSRPIVSNSTVQ
jgi:P27 family predicted phage terminase small subunit